MRSDRHNKEVSEKLAGAQSTKNSDLSHLVDNKVKKKPSLATKIKNMKTWKKIVALILAIILLAAASVFSIVYRYLHNTVGRINQPKIENYDLSLKPVDGYINLLLLGVDSRNMENIKGTRSDMIMIASINTETNDVTLTSVYRDTYLKIGDTTTYDKITHACVYGGPEMTMKSLNQAMDIDLENYAIVNFKAVADIVDAVGGIAVDVQNVEIQQLNKYTKQTAHNIGRKKYKLVEKAGTQNLEGVQAVSYGRIRKGVGDDFKRTERMRIVVSKVFEKLKTMSFSQIKDIIDIAVPQVKTNLDMNDILALGLKLPKYNIKSGSGWPYNWSSGLLNKVSYVFPAPLGSNTVDFHKEVFKNETYTPSSTVNEISNVIANRISAARASNQLSGEKKGQSVQDVKPKPDKSETPENQNSSEEEPILDKPKPEEPTTPENPNVPENPNEPDNPPEGNDDSPIIIDSGEVNGYDPTENGGGK